jgi:MFS family permease
MRAASLWILMVSVALLCVGHGLNGSLIGVRASDAEFGPAMTGIIMSGYSAGLLLSSYITPGLVRQVGHVRVFAGLASLVSTAVLLVPLWVEPWFWFAMRFAAGLCTSGLFIVCESWLNAYSTNANRGRILSLYMVVTYGSLGIGQLLLNVQDASGFSRFIIVSSLLSVSLVPLILLPTEAPGLGTSRPVTVVEIWKASPLAVFGAFANGLGQSAFFAMGTVYGLGLGLSLAYVSLMMALPPLFLLISQFPIGLASDRFDRRLVIFALCVASALLAGFMVVMDRGNAMVIIGVVALFGGLALPVYSLVIAHANDHMAREQILGVSAKLVLLYGAGSVLGPILVGQVMRSEGSRGFPIFLFAVYGLLSAVTLWRLSRGAVPRHGHAEDVLQVGPTTTISGTEVLADRN